MYARDKPLSCAWRSLKPGIGVPHRLKMRMMAKGYASAERGLMHARPGVLDTQTADAYSMRMASSQACRSGFSRTSCGVRMGLVPARSHTVSQKSHARSSFLSVLEFVPNSL